MERNMKLKIILGIVMMWMAVGEAVVSCEAVYSSMAPCLAYLTGQGSVSEECCNGVRSLNSQASTPAERRAVCSCLETADNDFVGLNFGYADSLPSMCGVNITNEISPSTDCSKVN